MWDNDLFRVAMVLLACVLLATALVAIPIYISARYKAEFYQSQGYNITPTQVFWGVQPTINKNDLTLKLK